MISIKTCLLGKKLKLLNIDFTNANKIVMKTLKVALDWTPNTNHIGMLVAKEQGFYNQENINVEFINPLDDNYAVTPGKKLELDLADFCIAPFETVISLNNKANKVNAIAVFAILQEDISSIASLKAKNINSPKHLDGKVYASYKARYEDQIVKEMIKNDGGNGEVKLQYPDKLGIWNTLLTQKADATWIFNNWEGVEAEDKNIELNKLSMKDYNIPYGYSPVIIAKKENIDNNFSSYNNFVKATKKGYLFCENNPKKAVEILSKYVTDYDLKNINLQKSIAMTIPYFGNEASCGFMNSDRVANFLKWLSDKGLENEIIQYQNLFSNSLL